VNSLTIARPIAPAVSAGDVPSERPPGPSPGLAERDKTDKVWVFFKDKGFHSAGERAEAVRVVADTYDPRAVERRARRGAAGVRAGGLFDERDVPVAPAYVDAVAATGARLHVRSRWLNAVSVQATREQAERIAALPCVARLQSVARAVRTEPVNAVELGWVAWPADGQSRGLNYGRSTWQLNQINLIALHQAGAAGQGVIVGILDTGFHRGHQVFNNAAHPLNVVAEHDFINDDGNTDIEPGDPPDQHAHGTYILGVLAAYLPSQLVGGAYDAGFILCKTEDTTQEVPAEEDDYVAGLEFIEAHGGDMATSSLSYIDWYTQADLDGHTAVTTIAVNVATALGVFCCTSAGNRGNDDDPLTAHLGAPADALQVITCGAVDSNGAIASFSSDGPSADGRVKPELLARGVYAYTVSAYTDDGYAAVSGTSLSAPLVAGAVACLIEARPAWTVDQMRSYLFQSADYYLAHGTYDPLYVRGYGVANAYAAAQDCNGNGVPDIADLTVGSSHDCNANGIPDECEFTAGDVNCDGLISYADINPFVLALSGEAAYHARFPACNFLSADCDGDCVVSYADINAFVRLLSGR
jgi:subtilisin family serine protease